MESLCKGLSGMDAARAAMGQGWPFVGGPHPVGPLEQRWSEGTRRSRAGCQGQRPLGYFWGVCQK